MAGFYLDSRWSNALRVLLGLPLQRRGYRMNQCSAFARITIIVPQAPGLYRFYLPLIADVLGRLLVRRLRHS
jgi:hypothetical protein